MSDLNKWLTTDIEEIPEADVSDIEKKRMKKRLLGQHRKTVWLKNLAIAAGIAIAVVTTTATALPSLASQIPILQDIVSYFDDDELLFNHFSEVAQPLGLQEKSERSTLTIEEAVFDGTSVTLAFVLETPTDLGASPNADSLLEASWSRGSGSYTSMSKVNDTTYAGMITMAPNFIWKTPHTVKLSWEVDSFTDMETGAKVEGDWKFDFKLDALESVQVPISEKVDFVGGSYRLDNLRLTKLSTVVTMRKKGIDEDHYMTDWQLKDDLGNVYPMQFGTGSGDHQQFTFEALEPKASSVTIEPIIKFVEHIDDPGVPVKTDMVTVELK